MSKKQYAVIIVQEPKLKQRKILTLHSLLISVPKFYHNRYSYVKTRQEH